MAEIWRARGTFSWGESSVTAFSLFVLLMPRFPKWTQSLIPSFFLKVPAPVIALPAAAGFAIFLEWSVPGLNIVTLGERFHTVIDGIEFHGIPRFLPSLSWPWLAESLAPANFELSMETLKALLPPALTIALLGAIESLLSAVVADGMARTRHEPDSELFALGLANFITPFFGGIPATGAIARTASNFRFGGRTPISAATHAVTVLLAVLVLAPLLSYLPMASMAALLLLVAWNMSEIGHFIHTLRVAPRSDSATLIICFLLTVFFDMVIAVTAGVLLGALFFIRRMASLTEGRFLEASHAKTLKIILPKDVVLYSINGPLFFGAAERAIGALRVIGKEIKVVVFLLDNVMASDMTGLVAMEGVVAELKFHGIKTILVSVQPEVKKLFLRGGLKPAKDIIAYAENIEQAMEMVGASWKKRLRRADTGPIRLQPLHRQRSGEAKEESPG
jgi:SulP family sulfate permease